MIEHNVKVAGTFYTKSGKAYGVDAKIVCTDGTIEPGQISLRDSMGQQLEPEYPAYVEEVSDYYIDKCVLYTGVSDNLIPIGESFKRKIIESIVDWDEICLAWTESLQNEF